MGDSYQKRMLNCFFCYAVFLSFLTFIPKTSAKLASFIDAQVYGMLPIFPIEYMVDDPVNEVPKMLEDLMKDLVRPEACIDGLFHVPDKEYLVERQYRKFMKTGQMPTFGSIKEKAFFLLVLLGQLPDVLINKAFMEALNEASSSSWGGRRMYNAFYVSSLTNIFEKPFMGRAILRDVLIVFAHYAESGCSPEGFFGVSKNVSEFISETYMHCGWWYKCDKFAQTATVNIVLRMGTVNIYRIFKSIPDEVTQHYLKDQSGMFPGNHWYINPHEGKGVEEHHAEQAPEHQGSALQPTIEQAVKGSQTYDPTKMQNGVAPNVLLGQHNQYVAPSNVGGRADEYRSRGDKLVYRQRDSDDGLSPYGYINKREDVERPIISQRDLAPGRNSK